MSIFVQIILFSIFFGFLSAIVASERGAGVALGFWAGVLLGPLGLLVAFLSPVEPPK
jgi:hypothetical protein